MSNKSRRGRAPGFTWNAAQRAAYEARKAASSSADIEDPPISEPEAVRPSLQSSRMPEIHSDDIKIDQPRQLIDVGELAALLRGIQRPPQEIVEADPALSQDYMDDLAFNNEWVTIRLEPSGQENEASTHWAGVNGRDAEILHEDKVIVVGHLPIGYEIKVRRCVVEVLAKSKIMRVETPTGEYFGDGTPMNRTVRKVSQTRPLTIIHDPSPRGPAWFREQIRRQF